MAVVDGARVSEIAAEVGVSRQSVHSWLARYRAAGLAGLADRPSRPRSSPNQSSPQVEARVCELRRAHPRWGAQRILHELMRDPGPAEGLPSRATVHRILVRHGLVVLRARRRKRSEYVRWQRPAAMQLWQLDIVYGPRLVDTVTGELREGRIVTGVDDHSRFCVLARVVERATGRAVCLAFSEALERYGAPEEVLTDNGKPFTDPSAAAARCSSTRSAGATASRTASRRRARRPRPARSSASIRRCRASGLTTLRRLRRCLRRRPRWMTGSVITTPIAHTRRSTPSGRSRRPSAFSPPARSSASCWGSGCPAALPPSRSPRPRRPLSGPSTQAPTAR